MRMVDLNIEVIKQAHADDVAAYRRMRNASPPQHMHRHWLLRDRQNLAARMRIAVGNDPRDELAELVWKWAEELDPTEYEK